MCYKGKHTASLFLAVVICVLGCVHHSHQAQNLELDTTKDDENHTLTDHHEHDEDEDHGHHEEDQLHGGGHSHSHHAQAHKLDAGVWLAATSAIFIISLCGIFGVMVIPIMQKLFYQHLIQFLVALAIGTLSGDALLHLFPHALMAGMNLSHEQHDEYHQQAVWRGFVALLALVLFFLFEKVINIVGDWKDRRRQEERRAQAEAQGEIHNPDHPHGLNKKVRIVRSGHTPSDKVVGERLCKHKYSAYCVTDVESKLDDDRLKSDQGKPDEVDITNVEDTNDHCCNSSPSKVLQQQLHEHEAHGDCEREAMLQEDQHNPAVSTDDDEDKPDEANANLPSPLVVPNSTSNTDHHHSNQYLQPLQRRHFSDPNIGNSKSVNGLAGSSLGVGGPLVKDPSVYDTVFIHQHEHSHHGHSHMHSHIHSKPDSISSVAWMVIFGDGIHNLADGMAIGAAFAESYISGLSTSIAVLCHELPHEIGDFAMLLKAGMTWKQAVCYNILSSILAFMGMIAGLLLGNIENMTAWIFCGTAGVFLYVALVDMIPELNSGHAHPYTSKANVKEESQTLELILQLLGMSVGIGIMLLIALYEHDLKNSFN